MNSLIDTPLHRAIKKAFPQTSWPQDAIDLLDKFVDGELIEAKELKRDEMLIMFDLAIATISALIHSTQRKRRSKHPQKEPTFWKILTFILCVIAFCFICYFLATEI